MPAHPSRRLRRTITSATTITALAAGGLFLTASPAVAATTATFDPSLGLLSVFGDSQDNVVTVSRNAAGALLVNGGAIPVLGGAPTVANTERIQVFGLGGDDTLTLNESSGALPAAFLFGGSGTDVLTGGSSADQLFGQAGNDTLNGKGNVDLLFGGTENDTLTGGDADDQVFGESGLDRMIWNPGDDTDLNEGGADTDTVQVNGGGGAEEFSATANGLRVRFDRITPAPFSVDIGSSENLILNANGGNDQFEATGNLAALIKITVDGGAGADDLLGSDGADVFLGGEGNDFVDGQQGNDVALLGAGTDTFQWDPGDGSDVIEGQADVDTMLFNGSNADERMEALANGGRVQFTRDVGNIVMDLNDLEQIDVRVLGGSDTVRVRDLSGTDVSAIATDLAAVGGAPDGSADRISVDGTNGDDVVDLHGSSASQEVTGLEARLTVLNADAAPTDRLTISAQRGDDVVIAASLAAPAAVSADGGDGNDVLLGGDGDDLLSGGDGDDVLIGGSGTDTVNGGPGEDVLLGEVIVDGEIITKAWLANRVRPIRGGTVLELGDRRVELPGVSADQLR